MEPDRHVIAALMAHLRLSEQEAAVVHNSADGHQLVVLVYGDRANKRSFNLDNWDGWGVSIIKTGAIVPQINATW